MNTSTLKELLLSKVEELDEIKKERFNGKFIIGYGII